MWNFKLYSLECGVNLNKRFSQLTEKEIDKLNRQRLVANYLATCNHIFAVKMWWIRLRQHR